jgi:hypothetical protein
VQAEVAPGGGEEAQRNFVFRIPIEEILERHHRLFQISGLDMGYRRGQQLANVF